MPDSKKTLPTIFSYAYSVESWNLAKMIATHLIELTSLVVNVVIPYFLVTMASHNEHPNTVQNNNSTQNVGASHNGLGLDKNTLEILIIASTSLVLTTILPKIRTLLINSVRFEMQRKMVLDMTEGVYGRAFDSSVSTPQGKYFAALTNNYHSVDRVMPALVSDIAPVVLETAGISGILWFMYGLVGVVPIATLGVYFGIAFLVEKISRRYKKQNAEAMAGVFSALLEATNNYQVAHQYGNVKLELDKLNLALTKLKKSYGRTFGAQEIGALVLTTSTRLGFVAAMLLAYLEPPSKTFWTKDVLLFAYYLFRFTIITDPLPPKISEFVKGYFDSKDVLSYLEADTTVPDPEYPSKLKLDGPPRIEFKHVSFSYDRKLILNDVSFVVEPGQKLAIMGATGSGKSTLLKLFQRFYPFEGQILINGVDIADLTKEDLRAFLAVVSQETGLIGGTLYDNIRYGDLEANDQDIEAAAKFAGLDFSEDRLRGETMGQGKNLSGGERQRLNIARALMKAKARIFLFDEPTSALDQETSQKVLEVLDQLTEDSTSIIVTHDPKAAINADVIVYLEDGAIVEHGTFNELMRKEGRVYDQVSVQCDQLGISVKSINTLVLDFEADNVAVDEFLQWRRRRREVVDEVERRDLIHQRERDRGTFSLSPRKLFSINAHKGDGEEGHALLSDYEGDRYRRERHSTFSGSTFSGSTLSDSGSLGRASIRDFDPEQGLRRERRFATFSSPSPSQESRRRRQGELVSLSDDENDDGLRNDW